MPRVQHSDEGTEQSDEQSDEGTEHSLSNQDECTSNQRAITEQSR